MVSLRVALIVLIVAVASVAADDQFWTASVTATVTNGTYNSFPTAAFVTDDNLSGFATVTLSNTSFISQPITVCFSVLPVFGSNLANICPSGGLVTIQNNTASAAQLEVKFARKSFSAFSSTKRLSGRFARAVAADATDLSVTLLPGQAYFVSVTTGTVAQTFTLNLSGLVCAAGSAGNPCQVVTPVTVAATPTTNTVNAPAQGVQYFMVNPADFNATAGSVTFTLGAAATLAAAAAPGGLTLQAQVGAPPTTSSFVGTIGTGQSITIENPSGLVLPLYVGVFNSNAAATAATLTSSVKTCADGQYGANCVAFSSTLISGALNSVVRTGSKVSGNNPLVYYQLDGTTIPPTADVVRVSVSSSTQTKSNTIYAKFGSPPSVSSYDYVASNGYVNQLVLPNATPALKGAQADFNTTNWYIAVNAANDFALWSGNNCAGACNNVTQASNTGNGYCICNGLPCDTVTTYEYPVAPNTDSYGVCMCRNPSKQNNYDCSALVETSSPFKTVYIVLIAVGGAIVLAVAIGVPVYCYLQNRKRDYERL